MNRHAPSLFFALAMISFAALPVHALIPYEIPPRLLARVVEVTDGNTIIIEPLEDPAPFSLLKDNPFGIEVGKPEKVRLYGIDAPEMDQPYGDKARNGSPGRSQNREARPVGGRKPHPALGMEQGPIGA